MRGPPSREVLALVCSGFLILAIVRAPAQRQRSRPVVAGETERNRNSPTDSALASAAADRSEGQQSVEQSARAEHPALVPRSSRVVASKEPADSGDSLTFPGDDLAVLIDQLERVETRGVLTWQHQRGAALIVAKQPHRDAITCQFADERPAEYRQSGRPVQEASSSRRRQPAGITLVIMLGDHPNVLARFNRFDFFARGSPSLRV